MSTNSLAQFRQYPTHPGKVLHRRRAEPRTRWAVSRTVQSRRLRAAIRLAHRATDHLEGWPREQPRTDVSPEIRAAEREHLDGQGAVLIHRDGRAAHQTSEFPPSTTMTCPVT
jgi:hypothetical protein